MEEAGWVLRSPCASDRRGSLAQLTDAGLARLEDAARGHVEEVRSLLFDQLSPAQQAALLDVSETLTANLAPGPLWPAAADRAVDEQV
jgi:DNA-binding MarR family transcriptional regulator